MYLQQRTPLTIIIPPHLLGYTPYYSSYNSWH